MEEDQSFTSYNTQSVDESEDYQDEEEQDLQSHLMKLKNGNLDQQLESMKYLRSQIKKISPQKVFRLFHCKYLDILNEIIRIPITKLCKEAIYNLCGILRLERKHYSFQDHNFIIDKIISLSMCDRLATIMGQEMQEDKFGKLVNKLLWINIEIVNYSQQKIQKKQQRITPPNQQPPPLQNIQEQNQPFVNQEHQNQPNQQNFATNNTNNE